MANHEKVILFKRLFTGLNHVYGTYDPASGQAKQVKEPVTEKVILSHLQGKQPYGIYLLVKDRIKSIAIDFDNDDPLTAVEFVNTAKHYSIPAYIERSKSKGYHVWIFFSRSVKASKARLAVFHILDQIDKLQTEVFPKHDELNTKISYGNFINAPLFGSLVPEGRTVFINSDNGMKPYPDQWEFLKSVERVSESLLDEIIDINQLRQYAQRPRTDNSSNFSYLTSTYGLPPCAQKMLNEGVPDNQRVSCFRLAIHLKNVGFQFDLALIVLNAWSNKNKPINRKRVITPKEIYSQVMSAYSKDYRGYGCEDPVIARYCNRGCAIKARGN